MYIAQIKYVIMLYPRSTRAFRHVEVRGSVDTIELDPVQTLQRPLEVADAKALEERYVRDGRHVSPGVYLVHAGANRATTR